MLNRVVLVGRLTRDPELRYTPNGVAVANFTLAVNRPFSNQQGEREADFINCVVWRKQAENVANYLKKGSLAGVDGRIQTRSYDNNEGRRVFVTEVMAESVQFLEPRGSQSQGGSNVDNFGGGSPNNPMGGNDFGQQSGGSGRQSGGFSEDPFANDGKPIDISDDDLPF
ncbi:single-stranded DNA-binding protein [Halalkalibacterium halodurans]|uniref:Single-stranded DNA-binding protein n=1 Tax=Halalkalibacterium halodurans (strain ATCC BAA-125 / DSM 18197 / FERM 7344 / JCM 9153 / C-125) TaxID=272558 RepID=SSB_HALH5|nr:single-stranded DNA-binding protein [Halalkalibacterium halodurans]Q9K5N9.1 RecName: Full=Single-stranded DNA-binding protein; Short=SSB [Halalkalibacterium halodurans C-125]MED4081047.1 single-stranded DNA-binding protein [Halalkalibacterium halodurans]MED4084889.1 single-stranded DNA-binding protein [Halalkalibacterium halodurans]MED4103481.1 single-stranded DNA-binding protein [Halalkalibacterium halodurans]MED4107743.1 single-stranded DNA-binding protein [Halalkalibacterium halodurans]